MMSLNEREEMRRLIDHLWWVVFGYCNVENSDRELYDD